MFYQMFPRLGRTGKHEINSCVNFGLKGKRIKELIKYKFNAKFFRI